ncbi:hypothetical protein DVH24_039323 [Malus domestica]|uniref:DUF4219 domain-containing protein n=1 Tax=Malus domestica TaxID=3750 RepID=A0A498HZU0_MALDO|nr:hypothetical protein DVH24_039323 [Malus domestica]
MAYENSFVQPAIPRLDGLYDHWSMLMENFLRSKEYWNLVEVGITAAVEGSDSDELKLKDLKANNYLFQAIDRSTLETILKKDTANDIYGLLDSYGLIGFRVLGDMRFPVKKVMIVNRDEDIPISVLVLGCRRNDGHSCPDEEVDYGYFMIDKVDGDLKEALQKDVLVCIPFAAIQEKKKNENDKDKGWELIVLKRMDGLL